MSEQATNHRPDAAKLAALLGLADDFIDKMIHMHPDDHALTTTALRLRGELVQAMGELRGRQVKSPAVGHYFVPDGFEAELRGKLSEGKTAGIQTGQPKPVAVADGKLYCGFVDSDANDCRNPARYQVGWGGDGDRSRYTRCCEKHLKDVYDPGEWILDIQTGQAPNHGVSPVAKAREAFETSELLRDFVLASFGVPKELFETVPQPSGDSDVAALAEAAQSLPLRFRVLFNGAEVPIIAERNRITSVHPFTGNFTLDFAVHARMESHQRLPNIYETVRMETEWEGLLAASAFDAKITSAMGCGILSFEEVCADTAQSKDTNSPEPDHKVNFREFL